MTGPLVPGKLGELQWVDSPDYGDRPDERRIPRVYDVDPAPLARMLGIQLGIAEGDPFTRNSKIVPARAKSVPKAAANDH